MQRFAALKRLSSEHHLGLVIARRAREARSDTAGAFAQLLADHIRFEESELFATAQRVLAPDALAALQDLHDRQAGPACGPREAGTASPG